MGARKDETAEELATLREYLRVDNLREPRRRRIMKHDQLTDDLAMIGRNAIDEIIAMRGKASELSGKIEMAIVEIRRLRNQRRVMADIIADALAVIQTIEGENTDEEYGIRALRNRMSAAISHVAIDARSQEWGDAKPCPTCESLARAVMMDQTGKT